MKSPLANLLLTLVILVLFSCQSDHSEDTSTSISAAVSTQMMRDTLIYLTQNINPITNYYASERRAEYLYQQMNQSQDGREKGRLMYLWTRELINSGENEKAIQALNNLIQQLQLDPKRMDKNSKLIFEQLALAHLRRGEVDNCLANHSAQSCILPISGDGIHQLPEGSQNAIQIYTDILTAFPDDLYARWLLNVAYMTLGQYPEKVPTPWLIPGLKPDVNTDVPFFNNISMGTGIDVNGVSGGCCVEDFNQDGFLDVMASEWGEDCQLRFFISDGNGGYKDQTQASGLQGITGGLNMIHADYNNDGFADVLVLRGAWLGDAGAYPNSLLKNNGDGTFEDVTFASGIASFHPSQAATWADFNNDGWLDVFIANEQGTETKNPHPCELYINNQDGTFKEIAQEAGITVKGYFKGTTSGDINNDGWADLYITNYNGSNYLFLNKGQANITFEDITAKAGVAEPEYSFPAWFWDYDNDGWQDLFAASFDYRHVQAAGADEAIQMLQLKGQDVTYPRLYRNNGDNTFSDVTAKAGMERVMFVMGSNFGDLNNDGFLDAYLGTGAPDLRSVVPNLTFLNKNGEQFEDITYSSGMGHVQKGHGIGFGDLDNDGDEDIYAVMGGAYPGDFFHNALFENPSKGKSWVCLVLEGTTSNRLAIGSRIKLTAIMPDGTEQHFYRTVTTGGSFGSSSLQQEIGLGNAEAIKSVEIKWANAAGTLQQFTNIPMKGFYKLVEGQEAPIKLDRKQIPLKTQHNHHHHHHEG